MLEIFKYQLFETVFCKTSSRPCIAQFLPKNTGADGRRFENNESIHFFIFLHESLTKLWKLVVFSLNLRQIDMNLGMPGQHQGAIFSKSYIFPFQHCFQQGPDLPDFGFSFLSQSDTRVQPIRSLVGLPCQPDEHYTLILKVCDAGQNVIYIHICGACEKVK